MSEVVQQKSNKKLYGIIAVIISTLAMGILLLSYLNRPQGFAQPGTIGIKSQGKVIAVLTMQDIRALPKVEKKVTISSASEGKSTDVWGGATMKDVLDSVDPQLLQNAGQVFARAEDGFTTALTAKEILDSDTVLIAYAQNGEVLKGKSEGGLGPFRLILAADLYGNRMAKYLNELEIN